MATNPSTLAENVGRITAPDASYPYGSAQDDSTGTAGDGTPIKKAILDDTYGFQQWLLDQASIVPSGTADTVLVSQYGEALLAVIAAAAVTVGAEAFWPTGTPPTGYLEEDGSAISRTTYADLFAVIGTDYGIGDGSTTFNLPSPQGRAIRIWDHGAGVDPNAASRTDRGDGTTGDEVGTNQDGQNEAHTHTVDLDEQGFAAASGATQVVTDTASNAIALSDGGDEARMINTNRMLIIKY